MSEGVQTDALIREAYQRVADYRTIRRYRMWRHRLANWSMKKLIGVSLLDWFQVVEDQERIIESNRRTQKRTVTTHKVLTRQRDECMRDLYLKGEPFEGMGELHERFEDELRTVQDTQGTMPPYPGPERHWPETPWRS